MSFIIVVLCLALLIVLISYFKVDAFIAFLISSILAGIALGIPLEKLPDSVNNGIGSILGGLTLIIVLGAMLGKLVAESGAAQKIASVMVSLFGTKHIQWGLMVTGFVVGIPLFYGIGFVLLVPLIFSIVYKYKLPAVYIGLPMLAALSVTHGFLPPHPSPVALVVQFNANIGLTLIYGLCLAIPAIIIAGPVFGSRLKHIKSGPVTLFEQKEDSGRYSMPGKANSFISATLPVFLLIIVTVIPYCFKDMGEMASGIVSFIGAPSIVMLIALLFATYTLGIRQGRSIKSVMAVYGEAVKDISMILLIIAGSGIFKQIMEDSGVSNELATSLEQLPVHPLILGCMICAWSLCACGNVAEDSSDRKVMEESKAAEYEALFDEIEAITPYKSLSNTNPIMTQRFGADPYAMVYKDRVYFYMTGDTFEYDADGSVTENTYGKINTISVVSTTDMVNFEDHGTVYAAGSKGAAKWAANSWAPAAAWKEIDGEVKFFLYFANSGGGIGVLTSDSPTGPFEDPLGEALINNHTPNCADVIWIFDPAVLVDDDGRAYLYFGGCHEW